MGDKKRFSRFAELIAQVCADRSVRIADVAGGRGCLQMALRGLGYKDIVTFDKRRKMANPIRQKMYRYEWFSFNRHRKEFGLVIAMHPDEGTDHSVLYAVENHVPFLVCPCCIRPSATSFWNRKNFNGWVEHLDKLAAATHDVRREILPISGRNLVLVGLPNLEHKAAMTIDDHMRETCAGKRERGNLYFSRAEARKRAAELLRRRGVQLRGFRCLVCGCWHIGKPADKPWVRLTRFLDAEEPKLHSASAKSNSSQRT